MAYNPANICDGPGYAYVGRSSAPQEVKHKAEATQLSLQILNPKLNDPNFLVLRERRRIFSEWIKALPHQELQVLDVGGRLQPYRSLLEERLKLYVAVDPVLEGMLDIVAVGEHLPFADASFDLVICTQVLNYSSEPARVIAEIHRVLKPGASLYLSVPAIFPRYHDQRWRFMPDGLSVLLSPFVAVEVIPEGNSIAGLFRMINLFFDTFIQEERVRRLLKSILFPTANLAGLMFDRFSHGKNQFTTNYSCRASKCETLPICLAVTK
jgi:SAM-dependent methyltransferase